MRRKRRSGITKFDAVLSRTIRTLEQNFEDIPVEDDRALPLVRQFHAALVEILALGPLWCPTAIAIEREETPQYPMSPGAVIDLRAELLQWFRSTVRAARTGVPSSSIATHKPIAYRNHNIEGRQVTEAIGDTRDLIVEQCERLMRDVKLSNMQKCAAPDCERLFVKVYRREFCSVQCQKRINTRKQRAMTRRGKKTNVHSKEGE